MATTKARPKKKPVDLPPLMEPCRVLVVRRDARHHARYVYAVEGRETHRPSTSAASASRCRVAF